MMQKLHRHVERFAAVLLATATLFLIAILVAPAIARAETCAPVPQPVVDLDIPRFYGDAKGSIVDPQQQALHDAAVAPLTAYMRHVTSFADAAWKRPSPKSRGDAATCALAWIESWARGNAWLGAVAQKQSEYQRKWDLAGLALAYLKVKGYATPEQRRVIEPYLMRFADKARAFFDDKSHQRNNHWYWLGLGLGAVAIAADSDRHWQMARGIMTDAAREIQADGTLPMELARQARAIHYHAFAVMPLVVLAELAAVRGEDWYAFGNGALHRLTAVTLKGIGDPTIFDRLAGIAQERPPKPGAGWLALYLRRFPDRVPSPVPAMPTGQRWLGGDVMLLRQALVGG